jgi:hypothetical protein
MLDPFFVWLRGFHDRYARVILAGIAALLLPLMVMTTVSTTANWRQDNERDDLLACFDEYAAADSQQSSKVREAAIVKDEATSARDDALALEGEAFLHLARKIKNQSVTAEDFDALVDSLRVRKIASRELDRAQANLDAVREEYPIPPAPSEFCKSN